MDRESVRQGITISWPNKMNKKPFMQNREPTKKKVYMNEKKTKKSIQLKERREMCTVRQHINQSPKSSKRRLRSSSLIFRVARLASNFSVLNFS